MSITLPPDVKIGFIGIGVMGLPMALNLVKGGHDLTVFDLNEAAIEQAQAAGAKRAATIDALARLSDVIITMLPDAPDVKSAALGLDGIESAAKPGTIYIDMSTIDPVTTRAVGARLKERGILMIDSPVARGPDNARAGTLALMIGGDEEVFKAVEPILRLMADTITHCGPLGNGVAMKLVNNFLSHGIVATVAEAMTIGRKAGLPLDLMLRVSGGTGTFNNWLHKLMPGKAFLGDFSPGFMSRLARKDQRLALAFAEELGLPLTIGPAVLALLDEAVTNYPRDDFTSVLRILGQRAGVDLRLEPEKQTA